MRIYNIALLLVIGGLIITFIVIIRYKKNINLLEKSVMKSKERFNTLFEEYKKGYNLNRETLFIDAKENLQTLHEDYPKLTNTDLAIIWLAFMDCDRDTMCKLLNISSKYYYNRRSIIQKGLNIQLDDSQEAKKKIEKIVKKYICNKKVNFH